MKKLLTFVSENRMYFGIPDNTNIFIELHAPWRATYTGRVQFVIHTEHSPEPLIFIKNHTPLAGQTKANTENHIKEAGNLLPEAYGIFDFANNSYSWAKKAVGINLQSLAAKNSSEVQKKMFLHVAGEILRAQSPAIVYKNISAEHFIEYVQAHMQPIIHDFLYFWMTQLQLSDFPSLPSSWSHGDLWCKDIFVQQEKITLIDWEWSTSEAPYGTDIIDFYITTAEHMYAMSTLDSWQALLSNAFPPLHAVGAILSHLWGKTGVDATQKKSILQFALLRSAARAISQDRERATRLLNVYLQCLSAIKKYNV